jgi:hypothetical protein
LSGLPSFSISRGSATGPLPVTVGDVDTPLANLSLVGTSQNTTLVPNANIVVAGTGSSRTVTITPAANQLGASLITLTLNDGAGGSTNTSFTLTVSGLNNPPTLNSISDLTLNEDPGQQTVSLSGISAGAGDTQPLTVVAVSSNPLLIPTPTVSYTSPNPTGSLSFTPVANATGTAVITVTVSDGQVDNGSVSRAFRVTLNPVNDAPTISNIPDQSTPEDTPLTVTFTIGDSESLPQSLIVSATSANTSLVAVSNLLFNGSGSSRTLTVVPSPDQSGTSLITVFVTDGLLTNSDSFQLTVVSVNDQPTLNPIANFCTNAATGNPSFSIPLTGITSGAANESQTLNVTASSSAFLSSVSVSYTSPNPNATLTIRPPNNGTGSSTITVTVTDSGSGKTLPRTLSPISRSPCAMWKLRPPA